MKLLLKRRFKGPKYTIGTLYIDGTPLCDSLEDTDRGIKQSDPLSAIQSKKVYGETAIPTGTYRITVNRSPKFGRDLPRLLDVPGYDGVLIHAGNAPSDTLGCILPGENKAVGKVLNSRYWETKILELLKGQKDITIEIQ